MDLEDLKTDLEIQLTQIQNSINQLQNSSRTSNNSQTDSLIFSELRTLLKEQNEKGEQSLKDNISSLNNNANSICRELRNSVDRAKSDLQSQLADTTAQVGNAISKNISSAESSFLETVKNGKAEITKAVNDQRKAIFKSWVNCLLFILIGGLCFCLGAFWWNYGTTKTELLQDLATEQIKKDAVADYKKTLTGKRNGIVELKELELEWAKDKDNVTWTDREKTIQNFKDGVQWAKDNFSK